MTTRRLDDRNISQSADSLDRQLTDALEAVPHVIIADDFAACIMSRVPARTVWMESLPARVSVGRRVALIAAAVLLIAMLGLAAPTHDANQLTRTAAEWTFAAEFVVLTVWLSLRPGALR